jgi:hypothetical protein
MLFYSLFLVQYSGKVQRLIPVLAVEKYYCRKGETGIQRLQYLAIME